VAREVHYVQYMKPGFLKAAMWVAVLVVPGGVLLLPALVWPKGAVERRAGATRPAASPDSQRAAGS
jgi:hypothetical protein